MSFFKKRIEFLLIYCFQLIISILNHFYLNRPFQFVSCCKIYLQFHHSDIARTIIFCQEGKSESFEWSLFDTWNMIKVQKIILPVFMRCTCCPQRRCSWHFPSCVACVKTVRSASSSWHLWCGCGMEFHFAALKERCLLGFFPEQLAKSTPLTSVSSKLERAKQICWVNWCQAIVCLEPHIMLGVKPPCVIK